MRYVNGIIVIISHYNSCGGREINNIHGVGTMEAKPPRQKRRKRKEYALRLMSMPQPMNAIINDEKKFYLSVQTNTKRTMLILINRRDKK